MGLGVKGQSNSVIAGSLRNAFRCSVGDYVRGVELLDACGPVSGTNSNQTPNAGDAYPGSESAGDKLRRRKGNSPDRRLRSRSVC